MKKIYMILAAALVMLAANSCDKANVSQDDLSVEPMVVNFTAQAADVKAQFNPTSYENGADVPVLWDGGEKLSIALGDNNAKDFARDCAEVVASEDKKSAAWEYDFSGLATEDYKPKAPYTFHVFCGAARAYRTDNQSKVLLDNIPSEQTPGVNSCDPKAIYLYSKSEEYGTWPSEVMMNSFEHLTAYGCITLGTGIPEEEKVQSVTITADAATNLSGATWYFYKTGNKYANYTGSTSPKSNPSITLKPAENQALQRENIWFGCRPTTDLKSLTFEVTTDGGNTYKVVKELAGKNFQAGKVVMMKINGFEKIQSEEGSVSYTLNSTDLYDIIGGSYSLDVTEKSGVYSKDGGPELTFASVATLGGVVNVTDVGRLKFGTGTTAIMSEFSIVITPQEGWIVKSITVNSAVATGKKYSLVAKVGENVLINVDELTADSTDYTNETENEVAGPVNVMFHGSTTGVFYISSISVTLASVE